LNEHEPVERQKLLNNTETAVNPNEPKIITDNTNLNVENQTAPAEVEVAGNPSNSNVTAKAEVRSSNQQKPKLAVSSGESKKAPEKDSEMVFVDPEVGRVIMKGNTIETDEVIVSDKGVVFKKPPIPPRTPKTTNANVFQLSPEQFKRLTPKQIQRLKEIQLDMERRRKIMELRKNANPPAPQPTPE
jgi:hypothetical protein